MVSIVLSLGMFERVSAQRKPGIKLPIVNRKAIYLPKPDYPLELENLCANGKVEIEVLIGEDGNVHEAKILSGDDLLFDLALAAIKGAKFGFGTTPSVKTRGIVVYNFPSEKTCFDVGVVNRKWRTAPKFSIHPHAVLEREVEIDIRVAIDVHSGKVTAAKALSGHPMIRVALENQALQIRFYPTVINSPPMLAKGTVRLKIKPDRSVKF
jgi:Gram-negative bacterial TonB protein C-terminal